MRALFPQGRYRLCDRRIWTAIVGAASLAISSGCATPPRAFVTPEDDIARAAGLEHAIEFRIVEAAGGPLDEPDTVGGTLHFADAVKRAVTSDPGLQAALARVHIARADADQARLLPNPVLNVVLRFGAGDPQVEASFVQPFVEALQLPRRASAADMRLREVAADAVVTALDVIGEVAESYVAAQASAALRPLYSERGALVERLVSTAKARLDVGEGTRADVVTLDAQRVELAVSMDRSLQEERANRLRLARLIGEPSSDAAWELEPWSAPTNVDRPEAEWIDAALLARPEIQAVVWRLKALGDDEALVRMLPFEGASAGVDLQRDTDWSAGPALSVPLPIFDDGQARKARITAQQIEARHELTLVKRKVVEQVRRAYEELAAMRVNLARIRDELLPLQRQRRQLAEDAYRAGQTDVTPLFLAEQALRIAETQVIEVEAKATVAHIRLQRAVGGAGVATSLASSDPASGADIRQRMVAVPPTPSSPREP